MKLTCNYVDSSSIGYGRMGQRLVAALRRNGVDVQKGLEDGPTNCLTWMSTPSHARSWYEGQHNSIVTMWETRRLAEGMAEGLDNFELVMVPSAQNVELFSEHHHNVKLVLLGVDETWTYVPRRAPEMFFDFLIGGSGSRKGTDMAVDAFAKVFPGAEPRGDGPIPRLLMKNPRREGFAGPGIEVIGGKITDQEELDLYARAHCYLQPSRGEGFGMQPLQAIAQGCPTILTAAHGHASFAHLGYGIGSTSKEASYFSHGYAGEWWEPNFDELCERMAWVYDNYDEAVAFAKTASEVARAEFTWDRSARMMIDAIGPDLLNAPYTGSGEPVEAELRKYRVIVNRQWKADIAGVSYYFEPGVVYHEPADVLRILFDGGILDPSCLVENRGLTNDQLARLGTYSASHSHCPSCLQMLNSQPGYADYLMAKSEVERLTKRVAELEGRVPA